MFLRPEIIQLKQALKNNRVVVLYGLPGVGKTFLSQRAIENEYTQIHSLKSLPEGEAYWIDDIGDDEGDLLIEKTRSEGLRWLISSSKRIALKDAKYIYLSPLSKALCEEMFNAELARYSLLDSLSSPHILDALCGIPDAIAKAASFLELRGEEELEHILGNQGYGFDADLLAGAQRYVHSLSKAEREGLSLVSLFDSFTCRQAQNLFGIQDDVLRSLFEKGLFIREEKEATFSLTRFADMIVARFFPSGGQGKQNHGMWALERGRNKEISKSAEQNRGTDVGVRSLSWLVENAIEYDASLLIESIEYLQKHGLLHSANLYYHHALHCIINGRLADAKALRKWAKGPWKENRDRIAILELDAFLAKSDQHYERSLKLYEESLALIETHPEAISERTRTRIQNNRIALLWESGKTQEAIDAALRFAQSGEGAGQAIAHSNLAVMYQNEEKMDAARTHYRHAFALHTTHNNKRFLAISAFDLGTLAHECGHLRLALKHHKEAALGFEECAEGRFMVLNDAAIASLEFAMGGLDPRFSFEKTKARFLEQEDALFREAIELYEKLANFYAQKGVFKDRSFDYKDYESSPDELRLQARILRNLERGSILFSNADFTQMRLNSKDSDDIILPKNSGPQRIFQGLMENHLDGKAEVGISTIASIGWPEEIMAKKSANNRVHVALNALRNAGLKTCIERTKQGYRIESHTFILIKEFTN